MKHERRGWFAGVAGVVLAAAAGLLAGCASQDYALYAKAQGDVDVARHQADAAKYKAMADIAASGDPSAKVAAVMALALGGQGGGPGGAQPLQAPQASTALQWAQVLVPGLTQIAGISANMRVGLAQSDNGAKVAVSTNETFGAIAGRIQAPAANITTTTTTTTTDSHNTDNHTVTPAPVVSTPLVVAPSTKVCTVAAGTGVLSCL
jgi:hypothetical protein